MTSVTSGQIYRDRRQAGRLLAAQVHEQLGPVNAVVYALPRGGVPVGFEVARALDAPLDVCVVRRLAVPGRPELAMGAIATGGYEVLDKTLVADLGISPFQIASVADREAMELQRRETQYRANRPQHDPHGRTAIVVDDGLATGFTMRAAIGALRDQGATRIVVAVPVGAPGACATLASEVDAIICPQQPESFQAVAECYGEFAPTMDQEVIECLTAAALNQDGVHAAPHGQS